MFRILFVFYFLFISNVSFGFDLYFVDADLLIVRDNPSTEGKRLRHLNYGDLLEIKEKTDISDNISGKYGNWVKISDEEYVFDAYLVKVDIDDARRIEGVISDYFCNDIEICYLGIKSDFGKTFFGKCDVNPCNNWTADEGMPEGNIGIKVTAILTYPNSGDYSISEYKKVVMK